MYPVNPLEQKFQSFDANFKGVNSCNLRCTLITTSFILSNKFSSFSSIVASFVYSWFFPQARKPYWFILILGIFSIHLFFSFLKSIFIFFLVFRLLLNFCFKSRFVGNCFLIANLTLKYANISKT